MLKEQVKSTRKLARRALHQESLSKAKRNEELTQFRTQRANQKRKHTRKILAEAESDFQKVMSSANSEKKAKRKRVLKGGNKF